MDQHLDSALCTVCFHRCKVSEGGRGLCQVRGNRGGRIVPLSYGKVSALALDPIEKKPLRRFYPGSMILSVGSFGCNLRCPFCQNHSISYSPEALREEQNARELSPGELVSLAESLLPKGNIGLAFTYNEPLTSYEYVRDCAVLAKRKGLKTVLVTNGTASLETARELGGCIDAMNIDLKGFTEEFYSSFVKGSLSMVQDFIRYAVTCSHVELTTLLIPGKNDSGEEMRELSSWVASLPEGRDIPLHLSRFFPRYHLLDTPPTPVETVYRLCEVARENLRYVYPGNC